MRQIAQRLDIESIYTLIIPVPTCPISSIRDCNGSVPHSLPQLISCLCLLRASQLVATLKRSLVWIGRFPLERLCWLILPRALFPSVSSLKHAPYPSAPPLSPPNLHHCQHNFHKVCLNGFSVFSKPATSKAVSIFELEEFKCLERV